MSASSSLCFREASQKFRDGEISDENYYHNILAHCTGYLHDEDDDEPISSGLSSRELDDAFASAVEGFMKGKDFIKGARIRSSFSPFFHLKGNTGSPEMRRLLRLDVQTSRLSRTHSKPLHIKTYEPSRKPQRSSKSSTQNSCVASSL